MEELRPYQIAGAQWLAQKKLALLADDMGLGKSAQSITAADSIGAQKLLVLCPAVARINWDREFRKFSSVNRQFHIVTSGKDPLPRDKSIICSYDLAVRLFAKNAWETLHFDVVIIDEAHFLKNYEAKRTKVVLGKDGLVRKAHRVWALTGTPMPNHPGELWTLLYTFGVTKLKYLEFVEQFCAFAPFSGPRDPMMQIVGANKAAIPKLKELLSTIMLRRNREGNLPPISFSDIVVDGGNVELPEKDLQKLGDWENHPDPIKLLEAMAGSVSTLRRLVGLQKIAPIVEMVREELESGPGKIVIFAVHTDVVDRIYEGLREFLPVRLYGATRPDQRQAAVDRFQSDPRARVFVGNILAAGTAITLVASDKVIFAEQDWVPANNAQAAKRCHRIGQTRPVTVRFVGLAGSIDEKIASIVRRKTQDVKAVFDSDLEVRENPFKKFVDGPEGTHN